MNATKKPQVDVIDLNCTFDFMTCVALYCPFTGKPVLEYSEGGADVSGADPAEFSPFFLWLELNDMGLEPNPAFGLATEHRQTLIRDQDSLDKWWEETGWDHDDPEEIKEFRALKEKLVGIEKLIIFLLPTPSCGGGDDAFVFRVPQSEEDCELISQLTTTATAAE